MPRKLSVIAVVVPLAAALLAGTSAAAIASAAVLPVPRTSQLLAIACTSARSCLAVGFAGSAGSSEGVIVRLTNGVPGKPHLVRGSGELLGIACASATSCLAVGGSGAGLPDNEGVLVPVTGGTVGRLRVAPHSGGPLAAVACENTTTCVAVGIPAAGVSGSLVLPVKRGVPGTGRISAVDVLGGVACPSATECLAVGNTAVGDSAEGVVVPIINGKPDGDRLMHGTDPNTMAGIACATATKCDAVGYDYVGQAGSVSGVVVPITDGAPGTAHDVAKYPLSAVACVNRGTCVAVGSNGDAAVPIANGVPRSPLRTAATDDFFGGIACATATACWAVGGTPTHGAVVGPIRISRS
jgi:hypothetical protein